MPDQGSPRRLQDAARARVELEEALSVRSAAGPPHPGGAPPCAGRAMPLRRPRWSRPWPCLSSGRVARWWMRTARPALGPRCRPPGDRPSRREAKTTTTPSSSLGKRAAPPDNAAAHRFWIDRTFPLTIETDPAGATVLMKPYREVDARWSLWSRTPLKASALPSRYRLRLAHREDGYEPVEVASDFSGPMRHPPLHAGREGRRLRRGWCGSPGDRPIPGSAVRRSWATSGSIGTRSRTGSTRSSSTRAHTAARCIGKEPVSSRRAGSSPGRRPMPSSAIRPGGPVPATWELGRTPNGHADSPGGGAEAGFEAAAYATSLGRSSPPSITGPGRGDEVPLRHRAREPLRAAARPRWATRACPSSAPTTWPATSGVVLETHPAKSATSWAALERAELRVRRAVRRGALGPAPPAIGFRCAKYAAPPRAGAVGGDRPGDGDHGLCAEKPVPDEVFRNLTGLLLVRQDGAQAHRRLGGGVEQLRHEKVSFEAAYAERVSAHLFLPRTRVPRTRPCYWPSERLCLRRSDDLRMDHIEFLLRSAAPCCIPSTRARMSRHVRRDRGRSRARRRRDVLIQVAKDLDAPSTTRAGRHRPRETRLLRVSLGAVLAPPLLAIEHRSRPPSCRAGGWSQRGRRPRWIRSSSPPPRNVPS